jgi:hypothetical protein
MKEDNSLWKSFDDLINARNDVAHRGNLPNKYIPMDAVKTARRAILWVKALEGSPVSENSPR